MLSIVQELFAQCKINTVSYSSLLFFYSLFIDIFVSTLNKTTVLLRASKGTFFSCTLYNDIRSFYSSSSLCNFLKYYLNFRHWSEAQVSMVLGIVMVVTVWVQNLHTVDSGNQILA